MAQLQAQRVNSCTYDVHRGYVKRKVSRTCRRLGCVQFKSYGISRLFPTSARGMSMEETIDCCRIPSGTDCSVVVFEPLLQQSGGTALSGSSETIGLAVYVGVLTTK